MKLMNFGSLNLDRKYGLEHFVAPGETKSANSYFEWSSYIVYRRRVLIQAILR